ncbi:ATP-binding protein [Candidatus Uabimicrobium sp. HlEnr_7]|uniref:ATP-binding protein n=1 Tax=Candidatus Uabimicrobium helgolandensis TaxID=3095367 RepID=UPI003556B92C
MRRLIWQIYPSYLFIILLSIFGVMSYISYSFHWFYQNKYAEDLATNAKIIQPQVRTYLKEPKTLQAICRELRDSIPIRITIIGINGKVLADTEGDVANFEDHIDREEIKIALKTKKSGTAIRYSQTLQKKMMYTVIPVFKEGKVEAFIRASISTSDVDNVLGTLFFRISVAVMLCSFFAIIISIIVAKRISKPLEQLEEGAEKLAEGKLSTRLPVSKFKEIGSLAKTMNKMAMQLEHKIQQVVEQGNEHEAVLASMDEGVVAIDNNLCIINMNRTAQKLLQLKQRPKKGQSLGKIVQYEELKELVNQVTTGITNVEKDIVFSSKNGKIIQTRGIILQNPVNDIIGVLIVMNDVTRLRKLEQMRREFVANVSHELRTPITSIKGFVETLLENEIEDEEQVQHFLKIIARQSDRLHFIIEDILTLSRIEQGVEIEEIALFLFSIEEVLKNAIQMCEVRAKEKNINIELHSVENKIEANINPELLEQAIVNLIDNAIKYSPKNCVIKIFAQKKEKYVLIRVVDQGRGIPPEHIPRLFERFYRVDKARSRELGGTGLGLAIVKHIVIAHKGEIQVESEIDQGSIFSIKLFRKLK